MNNNYYRITYNDIGIYEALKKYLCNNNNKFSFKDWLDFKKSKDVNWLKVPTIIYNKNSYSYFTELGFNMFMKKVYPLIIRYINEKNIKIEKYTFDIKKINLIYSDEHQIVIDEGSE